MQQFVICFCIIETQYKSVHFSSEGEFRWFYIPRIGQMHIKASESTLDFATGSQFCKRIAQLFSVPQ